MGDMKTDNEDLPLDADEVEGDPQKVAEKLSREITRLKAAAHSKDEFIRITNHELRTPLDVIRGNLDMVLKGETGHIPAHTEEYLSDALMGADRLAKLVNDMLDISRIESDRMKFTLEDVHIGELLKTLETEFTPIVKASQVALYLDASADCPHVFSDRSKLFQILDNLLGNAIKFTPPGGSITISARPEGENAQVSVKDTGIGISREDQRKLFKQFPDIDAGKVYGAKGIGLGLALVWQLVEKLGGEVWVESEGRGKGTTFSFRIPCSGTERAKALARYHSRFFSPEYAS